MSLYYINCLFSFPYFSTFGNLQKSSRQNLITAQRMRIPSKEHPPDKLAEWLQIFQVIMAIYIMHSLYNAKLDGPV